MLEFPKPLLESIRKNVGGMQEKCRFIGPYGYVIVITRFIYVKRHISSVGGEHSERD